MKSQDAVGSSSSDLVSKSPARNTNPVIKLKPQRKSSSSTLKKNYSSISHSSPNNTYTDKPNRITVACERCRKRHKRCHGGQPCANCVRAKAECVYVEGERKIVTSLRYIQGLQSENTDLKAELERVKAQLAAINQQQQSSNAAQSFVSDLPTKRPATTGFSDTFHTEKRLRTSTSPSPIKGSSQVTLNRLPSPASFSFNKNQNADSNYQILNSFFTHQNPSYHIKESNEREKVRESEYFNAPDFKKAFLAVTSIVDQNSPAYGLFSSTALPTLNTHEPQRSESFEKKSHDKTELLGNSCLFTLPSSNPRPLQNVSSLYMERNGLNYTIKSSRLGKAYTVEDFTLPPYEKALESITSFHENFSYHLYFVNIGQLRHDLKNTYQDTRSIFSLGINEVSWFSKLLIILAMGEMYHCTEVNEQLPNIFMTESPMEKYSTIPGVKYFTKFNVLLQFIPDLITTNASNIETLEALLLFTYYNYLVDSSLNHYLCSGFIYRYALTLGLHCEDLSKKISPEELEHRRRLWWTVYMVDRYSAVKSGFPLSVTSDIIRVSKPAPIQITDPNSIYEFEDEGYINSFLSITQLMTLMLDGLYNRRKQDDVLHTVTKILRGLHRWRQRLPEQIRVDYSNPSWKVTRQIATVHCEYFQCINLTMRPIFLYFVRKRIQAINNWVSSKNGKKTNENVPNEPPGPTNLSKYSMEMLSLFSATFQASVQTLRAQKKLFKAKKFPMFSISDRENITSSISTLILFNAAFGVNPLANSHISEGFFLLGAMFQSGNANAGYRRDHLIDLINALARSGIQSYTEDLSLQKEKLDTKPKANLPENTSPLVSSKSNETEASNIQRYKSHSGTKAQLPSSDPGLPNLSSKNWLPPISSFISPVTDSKPSLFSGPALKNTEPLQNTTFTSTEGTSQQTIPNKTPQSFSQSGNSTKSDNDSTSSRQWTPKNVYSSFSGGISDLDMEQEQVMLSSFNFDSCTLQNLELLGITDTEGMDIWGIPARFAAEDVELFPSDISTKPNADFDSLRLNRDTSITEQFSGQNTVDNNELVGGNEDNFKNVESQDKNGTIVGQSQKLNANNWQTPDTNFLFFESIKSKASHAKSHSNDQLKEASNRTTNAGLENKASEKYLSQVRKQQARQQFNSTGTRSEFLERYPVANQSSDIYMDNILPQKISAQQQTQNDEETVTPNAGHNTQSRNYKPKNMTSSAIPEPTIMLPLTTDPSLSLCYNKDTLSKSLPTGQTIDKPLESVTGLNDEGPTNGHVQSEATVAFLDNGKTVSSNSPPPQISPASPSWWSQPEQEMWTELSAHPFSWHSLLADNVNEWRMS